MKFLFLVLKSQSVRKDDASNNDCKLTFKVHLFVFGKGGKLLVGAFGLAELLQGGLHLVLGHRAVGGGLGEGCLDGGHLGDSGSSGGIDSGLKLERILQGDHYGLMFAGVGEKLVSQFWWNRRL